MTVELWEENIRNGCVFALELKQVNRKDNFCILISVTKAVDRGCLGVWGGRRGEKTPARSQCLTGLGPFCLHLKMISIRVVCFFLEVCTHLVLKRPT